MIMAKGMGYHMLSWTIKNDSPNYDLTYQHIPPIICRNPGLIHEGWRGTQGYDATIMANVRNNLFMLQPEICQGVTSHDHERLSFQGL